MATNGNEFGDRTVGVARPLAPPRCHNRTRAARFFPYGPSFSRGLNIAAGDVNGDSVPDLVVAPQAGSYQPVLVINGRDLVGLSGTVPLSMLLGRINPQRLVNSTGGFDVAVGNLTASGLADVVIAPQMGAAQPVDIYIFNKSSNSVGSTPVSTLSLAPYLGTGFKGPLSMTMGDFNGDGIADLIFGASGSVFAFNGTSLLNGTPSLLIPVTPVARGTSTGPVELTTSRVNGGNPGVQRVDIWAMLLGANGSAQSLFLSKCSSDRYFKGN
jgi:hypothetical protein